MSKEFERRHKEDRPVLAICYDFDKTLSPDDMQAQGYIQSVGYKVSEFWEKSNELASDNDMDQNLAYMYTMKNEAEGNIVFTKQKLKEYGTQVKLFSGVEEWFSRIRDYGIKKGVIVEHYIISSGLKEMIEGTSVANEFEKIYASSFLFNERGVAIWPAQVINYTNKTQFLFRIEKGTLDINDPGVNDAFAPEDIRVPFRNMIYIGDSDTDIPCMKLVNSYGGHSIGVYNADTQDKTKVYKMMRENRIKYFAESDYTDGSELDRLVKAIIDRTSANEALETIHFECKKEGNEADKQNSEEERKKIDLIIKLENSRSFAATHSVITEMRKITSWTSKEMNKIAEVAMENSQVSEILTDTDLELFFISLFEHNHQMTDSANRIKDIIELKKNN